MRIFIVGAGGYLGDALAKSFVRTGHTVAALARDGAKAEAFSRQGLQPIAGRLDDLVHPLVAQPEDGGELTQRGAVQVQAPDGPVELGPGHLGVALGIDQPFLGLSGLGEQLLIHVSTVTRRLTPAKGPTVGIRCR